MMIYWRHNSRLMFLIIMCGLTSFWLSHHLEIHTQNDTFLESVVDPSIHAIYSEISGRCGILMRPFHF
jgi:hypothetical protein